MEEICRDRRELQRLLRLLVCQSLVGTAETCCDACPHRAACDREYQRALGHLQSVDTPGG